MKLLEALLMDMMIRPFRAMFILLLTGFLCGVLTIAPIHYIWLNTIFKHRLEQELNKNQKELSKKLVYLIYEQRECVAKWKATSACVEWMQ